MHFSLHLLEQCISTYCEAFIVCCYINEQNKQNEGKSSMNKTRNWTQVVIAVAVVLLLVVVAGRQQRRSETPREEPNITVVVDEETRKTEAMPLERYVMGVVGGEMGRLPSAEGDGESEDWPEQAYAAQAILARTFILTWLEENPDKPIPSDVTEAQAYNADNVTNIIRKAVESTRGEVIYYKDKLARTFFHSYAGGETANAQEGLNFKNDDLPYIQNTKLPKNEYAPEDVQQWSASIPLSEIQQKLQEADVRVGSIQDITIDETGPSKRITKVTIVGSDGKHAMHGADFR